MEERKYIRNLLDWTTSDPCAQRETKSAHRTLPLHTPKPQISVINSSILFQSSSVHFDPIFLITIGFSHCWSICECEISFQRLMTESK
ncbi:hypothetical protein L2E82_49098 [Cichorium intybus]|uniref:Uncharacterized protein n=1 Tax=Cichorium intybus TaxID=13427 RepID=A0ACB8Z095_CICIN|nr:hypothetical protein L2E82_49098 [Cichorium intybus]